MQLSGHTHIRGVGAYLPDTIVKSDELMVEAKSERFNIKSSFISSMVGITERRISLPTEKPSTMAIKAAEIAITDAGINVKDIDIVIFCGIERDYCEPATAHLVQNELGINAMCFDVSNACHGFVNGLSIADSFINSGAANLVLITTGETPSRVLFKIIDKIKHSVNKKNIHRWLGAFTTGDGGGAMVLGKNEANNSGIKHFNFDSKGEHTELCYYRYDDSGNIHAQMLMSKISNMMLSMHRNLIDKTYKLLNWQPYEIDKVVCHQVGLDALTIMVESIAGVSMQKTTETLSNYGNLTSASIPINLALHPPGNNEKVLLMGAGSGLSISQLGLIYG